MNDITNCGCLPAGEHFAILVNDKFYDNNGYLKERILYVPFTSRANWEAELRKLATTKPLGTFQGIHVQPAKLAITVEVKGS